MGNKRSKRGRIVSADSGTPHIKPSMTVPSKGKVEFRGTPTTRTYPRTLADAFPKDPEGARWFYPPERERGIADVLLFCLGVVLWAGLAYLLAA